MNNTNKLNFGKVIYIYTNLAYAFYLIGKYNDSISLTIDIFKTDKNCYKAYLICGIFNVIKGYSLLRLNDLF